MKILVVGAGYVGLVTGTCLAELGFSVTCIDRDTTKIVRLRAGHLPILEDGLQAIVDAQLKSGRLMFSADMKDHVEDADIVMIAVGTPSQPDGQLDLSAVEAVTRQVAPLLKRHAVLVVKSTVPAGTCARLERGVAALRKSDDVTVVSNPEFLREGSAVTDFFAPDRIVIGSSNATASEKVAALYDRFRVKGVPFVLTDATTSELIKYAANGFLAMKITFINELAHLCNAIGTDVDDLARGIGLDPRIGLAFLKPGPGYGGSCFPKDILALSALGQEANSPVRLIESVATANAFHIRRLLSQASAFFSRCWNTAHLQGNNFEGRRIAVLGLAFKANTDDIRDSASLVICQQLLRSGAHVIAYDPAASENAKHKLPELHIAMSIADALKDAEGVIVMTEWRAFAEFDWATHGNNLMKIKAIVDFRNIFDPAQMQSAGFEIMNLGRRSNVTL
jgi:UDPglucose 6-dehydrogenase